ncbi:alanine racemase [Kineococcus sp. SYSU DK018]|uniref:alanine racemase n=1 Tax=Kineococcus sp. SYSU DK018 TaxID=3383139 RepID=UPI003D7CF1D2
MPHPPTPHLVVDLDVLERNLASVARPGGPAVRPHAKTHKCAEVARRQLAAGAVGLTVATVGEAEFFADAGCPDLFVAYPVHADADRARRLRALSERVALRVGVESVEAAELLGRAVPGLEVVVEVDSGHHRTGVEPGGAARVAVAAARAGLRVVGVFTFPGHGYGPGNPRPAAAQEAAALAAAADGLERAGLPAPVRSGGSTPTAAAADPGVVTEVRPGVYVFNDAQQVETGTCGFGDVALTAAGTVVSRRPGRVVLDAGSKVLGADRPAWASGFGRLPDSPGARVPALSEHHATVELPAGEAVPSLGDVVRVAPNHVCAAVNLADELVVVRGGRVVDRWPVGARGRNS